MFLILFCDHHFRYIPLQLERRPEYSTCPVPFGQRLSSTLLRPGVLDVQFWRLLLCPSLWLLVLRLRRSHRKSVDWQEKPEIHFDAIGRIVAAVVITYGQKGDFGLALILGCKHPLNMLRIGLDHTQIVRSGSIGFAFALLPTFNCI